MKPALLLPLLAALLLAGCSTIDRRIKEKSAAFAGSDAATQAKLKQGKVEIGYTPDQVYIALGEPDDKRERLTAGGREMTWIYSSWDQDYRGTFVAGHRRMIAYDPATKRNFVYWEPVLADLYSSRVSDLIRITFRDGKVTEIEQALD